MAEYRYDAYGNRLEESGSNTDLAESNPIRYRSYYYDEDTGLYYLNARYYNPKLRRFISPDNSAYLDTGSPQGLNLYVYCGNDPINYSDPSGNLPKWAWKLIIGTAFILGGALITAATAGAGTAFWATFGSALLSSTIQVGASMAVGIGVNGLVNLANGDNFFDNVGNTIASSYMWGGIFAGGAQILGGTFRVAANKGVPTGRKDGINIGNSSVKILSPDKNNWAKAGGTIIKFGNSFRVDVGAMWGLHIHILGSGHIPLGVFIAGLIGS